MNLDAVLESGWRLGLTLLALLALAAFWYLLVSNLTPFESTFSDEQVTAEKERERRFSTLRRVTVGMDVLFFAWLVVEGAFLVPWLFIRYGIR
ncbi:MAG: hypothetical protein QOI50_336 [Pseudonocardiales bacterium]|jgi:Na+-transporting methylmalonyl-CoA/oxaloacetate decarboxylase beta subunit|nr:hypothetical protein [Pseudonocardiales bacterium]MDT7628406.1 hypothetical protein [Pseudonocardiales bacterium]MDT7670809.1 hypothetical protein [Pseudonocardiales bacterium]MDT7681995.1 hypothetical protein [Pseudonocardiales bacterium]